MRGQLDDHLARVLRSAGRARPTASATRARRPVATSAGGLGARRAELVGQESVEALGRVRQHREAARPWPRRWSTPALAVSDRWTSSRQKREGQRERAAAHRDVGDVERRPATSRGRRR